MENIPHKGGRGRLSQPVGWLAAASGGWLGLIVSAPAVSPPLSLLAYAIGGAVCHQIAERSFHIGDAQLAVCARCTGIYAGAVASFVWQAVFAGQEARHANQTDSDPVWSARLWLVCGALPTVLTVVLEQSELWHASNAARAMAGAPLGCTLALVVGRAATLHLRSASSKSGPAAPMPRS